jgi:hypothetical protein
VKIEDFGFILFGYEIPICFVLKFFHFIVCSLISNDMSCVEMLISHMNDGVGTLLSAVCFRSTLVGRLCSDVTFTCA